MEVKASLIQRAVAVVLEAPVEAQVEIYLANTQRTETVQLNAAVLAQMVLVREICVIAYSLLARKSTLSRKA